jgi:hypothetical protein
MTGFIVELCAAVSLAGMVVDCEGVFAVWSSGPG